MNQCVSTSAFPASDSPPAAVENVLPTDSFAAGMTSLIALSVVQKVVGLLRTILFCWLLSPDQLGRSAHRPGVPVHRSAVHRARTARRVQGKYAEYFRQRGQLRAFLRQTLGVCSLFSVLVIGGMLAAPARLSQLVLSRSPPAAADLRPDRRAGGDDRLEHAQRTLDVAANDPRGGPVAIRVGHFVHAAGRRADAGDRLERARWSWRLAWRACWPRSARSGS